MTDFLTRGWRSPGLRPHPALRWWGPWAPQVRRQVETLPAWGQGEEIGSPSHLARPSCSPIGRSGPPSRERYLLLQKCAPQAWWRAQWPSSIPGRAGLARRPRSPRLPPGITWAAPCPPAGLASCRLLKAGVAPTAITPHSCSSAGWRGSAWP